MLADITGGYWSIMAATGGAGAVARAVDQAAGLQEGWIGMAGTICRRGVAAYSNDTMARLP